MQNGSSHCLGKEPLFEFTTSTWLAASDLPDEMKDIGQASD